MKETLEIFVRLVSVLYTDAHFLQCIFHIYQIKLSTRSDIVRAVNLSVFVFILWVCVGLARKNTKTHLVPSLLFVAVMWVEENHPKKLNGILKYELDEVFGGGFRTVDGCIVLVVVRVVVVVVVKVYLWEGKKSKRKRYKNHKNSNNYWNERGTKIVHKYTLRFWI